MPRSVQRNASTPSSARYSGRHPSEYVSSTSIESRRARKVLSMPSALAATTANGSPFATRTRRLQPFSSVSPSITLIFALEYTVTLAPSRGVPFISEVTHTPGESVPFKRTESPRSERQTSRYRLGFCFDSSTHQPSARGRSALLTATRNIPLALPPSSIFTGTATVSFSLGLFTQAKSRSSISPESSSVSSSSAEPSHR